MMGARNIVATSGSTSSKQNEILPWSSLLKIAALVIFLWVLWIISSEILLFLLGVMLAVTLSPILNFLVRQGVPRWLGIFFILATLLCIGVLNLVLLFPILSEQFSLISGKFLELRELLFQHLPPGSGLEKMIKNYFQDEVREPSHVLAPVMFSIKWVAGSLWSVGLCAVFSAYLLIDGPRAYTWILDFFSTPNRQKLEKTAQEVSEVIIAYSFGQLITSILCGAFAFLVLAFFNVPAAIFLAVVAAIFDVLPIVGIFLFSIPAILMALTVSPSAAIWVSILFFIYHMIESYWIVPLVYGNRLKVSGLAVLCGLVVGDLLGGIAGALAVLPVVASYPIVERIWLADYLGSRVVKKHEKDAEDT
jgi:predicted PurR-regulated permease PerM